MFKGCLWAESRAILSLTSERSGFEFQVCHLKEPDFGVSNLTPSSSISLICYLHPYDVEITKLILNLSFSTSIYASSLSLFIHLSIHTHTHIYALSTINSYLSLDYLSILYLPSIYHLPTYISTSHLHNHSSFLFLSPSVPIRLSFHLFTSPT